VACTIGITISSSFAVMADTNMNRNIYRKAEKVPEDIGFAPLRYGKQDETVMEIHQDRIIFQRIGRRRLTAVICRSYQWQTSYNICGLPKRWTKFLKDASSFVGFAACRMQIAMIHLSPTSFDAYWLTGGECKY
jgi:hypothetical protein